MKTTKKIFAAVLAVMMIGSHDPILSKRCYNTYSIMQP